MKVSYSSYIYRFTSMLRRLGITSGAEEVELDDVLDECFKGRDMSNEGIMRIHSFTYVIRRLGIVGQADEWRLDDMLIEHNEE